MVWWDWRIVRRLALTDEPGCCDVKWVIDVTFAG